MFTLAFGLNAQKSVSELWNPPIGQDRFSLTYAENSWLEIPDDVELNFFSPGFSASIMHDFSFGKSVMSFAWGYGIDSHNVRLKASFYVDTVQGKTFTKLTPFSPYYSFKKNKWTSTYLEIPLEFRLRTRGENQFKIYLGGKVGYLVGIHNKIVDNNGKRKFYGLENVSKLRYGLTAKVGINNAFFSAFYSLTPLLKPGRGDNIRPVSLGITFYLI